MYIELNEIETKLRSLYRTETKLLIEKLMATGNNYMLLTSINDYLFSNNIISYGCYAYNRNIILKEFEYDN